MTTYSQSYYAKNRDAQLAKAKARLEDPHFRRRSQVAVARSRALEKGIPFTIKAEDIEWPAVCPIMGTLMFHGGDKWSSPSLDRVIPELGYVPGNVRVISTLANTMKNHANFAQLKSFSENIMGYLCSQAPDSTGTLPQSPSRA